MEAPKGKNFSQMTKEELQECARIGQAKGTETKRRKKSMKSVLEVLLKMPVGKGKVCEVDEIKNFASLAGKNISVEEAIIIKQIQRALKGDLNATQFIRDTSGQKPEDNLNITELKPVVISGEDDLE